MCPYQYVEEYVSLEEYIVALNNLTPKARALLFALFDNANDHSASEGELAHALGYSTPHSASLQIGMVGKRIAEILNKKPKNNYSTGPAWFHFIGGRYPNEKPSKKNDERWEMNEKLAKAIEIFRSKKSKVITDTACLNLHSPNICRSEYWCIYLCLLGLVARR